MTLKEFYIYCITQKPGSEVDERFSDYKECGILSHWIQTSPKANGGLKPKHIKMANHIFNSQI